MSLNGKKISSTFKNILNVNNASGTGLSASLVQLIDGNGNASPIQMGTTKLLVKPSTDTTTTLDCKSSDDTRLLTVDTTNKQVLVSESQVAVNTQTQVFGSNALNTADGYHSMMYMGHGSHTLGTSPDLGNGTDPATTFDLSGATDSQAKFLAFCYWTLPFKIKIDQVKVQLSGGSNSCHFHLMSYDVSTGAGTKGDLSGGTVLANSSADIASPGNDALVYDTLALTSEASAVASGKVVIATLEAIGGAANVYCVMQVKYHHV